MSKYDVIVLGATGFVGRYVVEELARLYRSPSTPFTWAVAGRSKPKLEKVLKDTSQVIDFDVSQVDKLVIQLNDLTGMMRLAAQCCVLINCVGPYIVYGETILQACLLQGTDYVDLNAEIQSVERLQLKYHEEAKSKNSYIINSCGFETIPVDCGIAHLQKTFGGDINSVVGYAEINTTRQPVRISKGVWRSIVLIFANPFAYLEQQKQLYPQGFPKAKYSLPWSLPLHRESSSNGWCAGIPVSPNGSSVKRSQYHLHHEGNQRPLQFQYYFKATLFQILSIFYQCFLFFMMAQFSFGREFLLKYAEFFTNGVVQDKDPSREELEVMDARFTLTAEGWNKKLPISEEHPEPPNKKKKLVVTMKNPVYGASAIIVAQAALTLLMEKHKMPSSGGVYTPGIAFADTSIVERLNSRGILFKSE